MAEGALPAGAVQGLVLAIDTCGPSGSVALGRLTGDGAEILGQKELAGRSYSATLVAAVGEVLAGVGVRLNELAAMVAVSGPGSFTGVRVGLSAVKGLAEVSRIPVVAVSRLEVLAWKAEAGSAALDAHRHEVFLRLGGLGMEARELLAGAEELAAIRPAPERVAVCDEAAELLIRAWPETNLVRVPAPTAVDALRLCAERVLRGEFVDLALLDGHYLRRSDAEIFGGPGAMVLHTGRGNPPRRPGRFHPPDEDLPAGTQGKDDREAVQIRRMKASDLPRVIEIEQKLKGVPHWSPRAWEAVLDPGAALPRIAMVAEDLHAGVVGFAVASMTAPEAELESMAVAAEWQRRGVGRRLFGGLTDELLRAEVWEVFLEVRASNQAACGLYGALGFGETGRRTGYYADPSEDAVLMRMRLG
jgi:tRNA threonylcarbamoyladenosine biosynthesis protein TsaB